MARKTHMCDWCSGKIEHGQAYERQASIGDDGFYEWKSCLPCLALVTKVGDTVWDIHDGISEDDYVEWANNSPDDPDAVAYLARRPK